MNIKETFDNEAEEYDFTSRAVNIYFDEALNTLVENINIKSDTPVILDVCCGTGILTEKVALKFPKAEFIGVDFSTGMLKIAKDRMKNYNFNFLVSDVCDNEKMKQLPMVDLIITSFGIHNIHGMANKQTALNNILNHLKVGGQYITCDLLKAETELKQQEYNKFQKDWLLKTYTLKESEEWMNLLTEEDDPETLNTNFQLLKNAKLENIKLIWQKEFLGIWQGTKI